MSAMISYERATMLILAVTLFVTSGSALRCWDCSSNVNVMCNDPMNTTDHQAAFHIKTCDTGYYGSSKPICRKIVKQKYGERIVIRQCSTAYHDEVEIGNGLCGNSATQSERDVIESCHICNTDLCNSATDASATRLLYIGALISFAYIFQQSKHGVF
ncbi:UPAR/Ly6 domain-containing protein crok [Formica fusca]